MASDSVIFLEPKGTLLEVVRAAKRRGLYVVALMRESALLETQPLPYRTAVASIDEIIGVDSWADLKGIQEKAEEIHYQHPVKGIFFGVDACAVAGAELRQRYHLPTPKPEAIAQILNKHTLRQRLREAGLSRLRNFPGKEVDAWTRWQLEGSAYFKPVHGAFSLYVERCENLEELEKARRKWQENANDFPGYLADFLNAKREYHLEEAFDGELMSVEAISVRGEFHCLGLTSRILYSKNPIVEMGSCFPYPHPLAEKIIEKVRKAHLALGFTDGPSHTEVIVNRDREIEIIDFNPRFIGADVLQSINFAYGIQIEECLLDWALGLPVRIEPKQSQFSCLQYVLPPKALTFLGIEFPKCDEVKFSTFYPKEGTEIANVDRQIDYLGCYLTVLPGFDRALQRSLELRKQVIINNEWEGAY
jgi:biotin carboxylase